MLFMKHTKLEIVIINQYYNHIMYKYINLWFYKVSSHIILKISITIFHMTGNGYKEKRIIQIQNGNMGPNC